MGQSDCYLKYIICLNTCDDIDNSEVINEENQDVCLPLKDLVNDLVMYDLIKDEKDEKDENLMADKDLIKRKINHVKTNGKYYWNCKN